MKSSSFETHSKCSRFMGCPGSEKGDVVMKKVKIILQQDVNYLLSRYEKKGELKSEFKNITIPKGFSNPL